VKDILISISLISFGIFTIWFITRKKKSQETVFESGNRIKGIFGGIAFILIGIIKILNDNNLW